MIMPYVLDIPTCIIAFFDSYFASPEKDVTSVSVVTVIPV